MRAAGRVEALASGQILFSPATSTTSSSSSSPGGSRSSTRRARSASGCWSKYGPRQFVGEMNLITAEPTLMTARVAEAGEGVFLDIEALRGVVAGIRGSATC